MQVEAFLAGRKQKASLNFASSRLRVSPDFPDQSFLQEMIFAEMATVAKFILSSKSETDTQSLTNNDKSNSQFVAACGLLRQMHIPQKKSKGIQQPKPSSEKIALKIKSISNANLLRPFIEG